MKTWGMSFQDRLASINCCYAAAAAAAAADADASASCIWLFAAEVKTSDSVLMLLTMHCLSGRVLNAAQAADGCPEVCLMIPSNKFGCLRFLGDMHQAVYACVQYGGSEAHSTFFQRQRGDWEAATQSRDFLTSIRRFYSNAYTDAEKQDAINLFLGNFVPQHGHAALWELDSDYFLHAGAAATYMLESLVTLLHYARRGVDCQSLFRVRHAGPYSKCY